MADSTSQNSDSSNATSQQQFPSNFQGSYYPNSSYEHPYAQQQFPSNFPSGSNYFSQQFPSNYHMRPSFSSQQFQPNFPSGSSNFSSQHFPPNFLPTHQQLSPNLSTGTGNASWEFPSHSSRVVEDNDLRRDADKKKKKATKTKQPKWSHDEEIYMIKAYFSISTNAATGNEQKSLQFWNKVADFYNNSTPDGTLVRNTTQVKNRFYKVNPHVTKFAGYYNNFWSNRESGQDDAGVLDATKRKWRSEHKQIDFKYEHIWKIRLICEKWAPQQMPSNPCKKAKNSEDDSPSSAECGPRSRPMGQQRAKRASKQKASNIDTSAENKEKWNKMQSMLELQMNLDDQALEMKQFDLCNRDTSGMSEAELFNFNKMIAKIKITRGWM